MNYTFFVDESGQSGIKKIRGPEGGGSSRYMTLGGVLVPNIIRDDLRRSLQSLAEEFKRKELHCNKLGHNQIVRYSQELSKHQVLLFGVISLKETLGWYGDEIEGSEKKYYNKCAQYLLERLALSMKLKGILEDEVSICFEEGNFDYNGLRGLVAACRRDPRRPATKNLTLINPNSIFARPKDEEPLLQTADLVAHALFRCVDDGPSTYGVFETRYIDEMRTRFYGDEETGLICGSGLFPVHKLKDIGADQNVFDFLEVLKSTD